MLAHMKNRTNLIFWHKLIKAFADSMIKAFIPVIIYKSCSDMFLVMLYLSVYYFLCFVQNWALKKLLQKYGVIAMALHAIPLIALQFLLGMQMTWWFVIILAVLASIGQVLYSVPLNILFSFTDKNVNVAKFQISTNVGKLIFILLSGYVLGSDFSNSILVLSLVGSALYIGSAIPILFGYRLLKDSYKEIMANPPVIDKKSYRIFNLFHMAFSIFQTVLDVIVPLYLCVENLTYEAVAIVMALIELCKIGANLLAKLLVKKNLAIVSTIASVVFLTAGCLVMMFVKNAVVLYVCSCCVAVSFPLLFVPMFSTFVKKVAQDNNQFDGMVERDIYIMLSKNIVFLPYFIFPNLLGQFVIGIISAGMVAICSKKILSKK